jgi:plasmid stability protein
MKDESRDVLRAALSAESARPTSAVEATRARTEILNGHELEMPIRKTIPAPRSSADARPANSILWELLRPNPKFRVLTRLSGMSRSALFPTRVTHEEISRGIGLLPAGPPSPDLLQAAQAIFDQYLAGQVLSFDSAAADLHAEVASTPIGWSASGAVLNRDAGTRRPARLVDDATRARKVSVWRSRIHSRETIRRPAKRELQMP